MTPQKLTTLTRRFLKQWEKWPEAQWSCAQITIVRARLAQDFSALAGWIEREPYSFIFFLDFIYLYLERGEEKEKEGERNIHVREKYWLVASHTPPNGDLTHNPGVCPDWELNLWPFGSQAALNPLSHTSHGRNPTFQRKHWMSFCYSCLCLCVHVCDMYIYAMGYIL